MNTFPLLMALLLCLIAAPAQGAEKEAFALVPANRAEELIMMKSSPEGKTVSRWAEAAAVRQPSPLPKIHIEGTLPHQGIYDQSKIAKGDWEAIRDLSLAYRLSGEAKYLIQANRFFLAWLDTYHLSFNPIDESGLDALIIGYDLVRRNLPPPTGAKMQNFLRRLAEGYVEKIEKQKSPDAGNWQSHRIKLITLSSFSLGDLRLIGKARKIFQDHISRNILPDGSVWDFHQRDALHYVTYDLEPLVTAALAARAHGEDWFRYAAPDGASLERALEWLRPYANGEKTHEEFVHSNVRFDYVRREAGLKGFSGTWDRKTAGYLYQLAMHLDEKYAGLAQALGGKPQPWMALCVR